MQCLRIDEMDYPDYLRFIPSPPRVLFYVGDLIPLLTQPRLTVIGSRRVTPYGRSTTASLVHDVAGQGIVIVSGLALGVDGIAHQAAIDAGGKTIAVLPSGLERTYPSTHQQLAQSIVQHGGALISEYPVGTPPLRQNLIARNRIVSGLGDGVLITEAAAKSGTLHTANFALEQGRTVMAVPGNITSELSAGTNNLIKSGALPITDSSDIFLALGYESVATRDRDVSASNDEEAAIIHILKEGITDVTELLQRSTLPTATFNQTLTMLELTGKVRPLGAGQWTLV